VNPTGTSIKWMPAALCGCGGRGMKLPSHRHLVPSLRLSGAVPPPIHDVVFIYAQGQLFFFFNIFIRILFVAFIFFPLFCLSFCLSGHPVAQVVEALRYKPEGRGFNSRWCHWNLSLT